MNWSLQLFPSRIFTDNETNYERLYHTENSNPYVKDAFHGYVVHGNHKAGEHCGLALGSLANLLSD